jgi:hypothetical protein
MASTISAGTSAGTAIAISGDTSGNLAFQTSAGTYTQTMPNGTGTIAVQGVSTNIVSGTAVASTSGTSIDFNSIPSWVKRVTVMFSGVSTSGTSVPWLVQIGPSGGVETTGYLSSASGSTNVINSTTGFAIYVDNSAATIVGGAITLLLLNSSTNLWSATGEFGQSNRAYMITLGGSKAIAGSLSTIKIKATNGTDTFDAGSINILYE